MAYTFTTKPSPSYGTTGELDNFNNLTTAGAHTPIDAAAGIQTTDATTSPVQSPVALTTAVQLLNLPKNASFINMVGSASWTFSELSSNANYVSVASGAYIRLPCTRMTALYVSAATTANLSFWFEII